VGDILSGRTPALVLLRGTPGAGVTTFLRRILKGRPHLLFPALPRTDGDLRRLMGAALERTLSSGKAPGSGWGPDPGEGEPIPDWPGLLLRATAAAPAPAPETGPPFVLAVDDAHHLLRARSDLPELLSIFMRGIQRRGIPFHLVLAGTDPPAMALFAEREGPLGEVATLDLPLPPLPFREAMELLPSRWSSDDRLLGWSVVGGIPRRLSVLASHRTLGEAVRGAVLEPDGPLHLEELERVAAPFQNPARYLSVLAAVAAGAREWGEIASAVPEPTSGTQLAPYIRRLHDQGLMEVITPLDARAGSRNRRYRVTDPYLLFWHRFVLPRLPELASAGGATTWSQDIRPELGHHLAALLPVLAREYLLHHGREVMGSNAREVGLLLGPEHEIEPAGTLQGGGVFYGRCRWQAGPLDVEMVESLNREIRETRFGIGREARHRLLFAQGKVTPALRHRLGRDPYLHVLGARELLG